VAIGKMAKAIVSNGITEGAGLETLVAQMNALLPTAKMAQDEVRGLFELGTRTIAPTETLIELDMRLLRAGGSAAQMRKELVEGFAAMSSAAQLTESQMGSLIYLLGEVNLKGRLMRTEFTTQFSSAGLGTGNFMAATAEATGKSVAQLNQELEDGTFSAEQFNLGMVALFNTMGAGAQGALGTLNATLANTKDALKAGLASAFYDSGAVAAVTKIAQAIKGMVEQAAPYFRLIADEANRFFTAIGNGLKSLGGEGTGAGIIATLFGRIIPGAIRIATYAVQGMMAVFAALKPIFVILAQSVWAIAQSFGGVGNMMKWVARIFAGAAIVIIGVLGTIAAALRFAIGIAQAFVFAIRAVASALTLDFAGAASNMYSAVGAVVSGGQDAIAMFKGLNKAASGAGKAIGSIDSSKAPELGDSGNQPLPPSESGKKGGGGKGGGSKGSTAAANALAQALANLYEQTRRWLGQRSQLEQSLMGGLTGFSATADQIIDQGIALAKTLKEAGYSGESKMVKAMKRDVMALAKLAKMRDELQKKLEEQQQRLEDLRAERSSMAASVSQGVTDFVSALQVEEETVTEYTRLDPVGSFVLTEKKKSKSWVGAMKDRLKAVKEFVANIRKLKSQGLNEATIRQLVEAGPEAAAAAIKELTAGGQGTINEVNSIQSELSGLAKEFGDEQAGDYYDAGIASAEGIVAGIQSEIDAITAQADAISKALTDRLRKIAKPMKDAGAGIGKAIGGGIGGGLSAGLGSIKGLGAGPGNLGAQGLLKNLGFKKKDFEQIGRDFIDGLKDGVISKLREWWGNVKSWFKREIVDRVTGYFETNSPSKLFFRIGKDVIQGLWNGITSWFGDIKSWVEGKFTSTRTWLTVTLPGSIKSNAHKIWDGLKSGFPDMLQFVKDKFARVIDWITGTDTYAGGGLPGAFKKGLNGVIGIWNNLSFKFPEFKGDWNGPFPGGDFTIGGWTMNTPNIPLLASGGVTKAPTLAGIGERGREAVLPLTNPRAMAMIGSAIAEAGGGAPSIQVFIGDQEITDMIRVEVRSQQQRTATRLYAGRGMG
jgi:hypothetical protein